MQGRYHLYRLHPFTVAELTGPGHAAEQTPGNALTLPAPADEARDHLRALLEFGGFPEPLLAQSARAARRWQRS